MYADCTDFRSMMNLPGATQHTKGSNSRKLQTCWRCVFRIEFDIETGPWPPCPPQCRRVASCELVHILTFRRWPRENRTHNIIRRVSQFRNAKRCLYNILLFSFDRLELFILIESFYIIKTHRWKIIIYNNNIKVTYRPHKLQTTRRHFAQQYINMSNMTLVSCIYCYLLHTL